MEASVRGGMKEGVQGDRSPNAGGSSMSLWASSVWAAEMVGGLTVSGGGGGGRGNLQGMRSDLRVCRALQQGSVPAGGILGAGSAKLGAVRETVLEFGCL